jgi:hypothetical protein
MTCTRREFLSGLLTFGGLLFTDPKRAFAALPKGETDIGKLLDLQTPDDGVPPAFLLERGVFIKDGDPVDSDKDGTPDVLFTIANSPFYPHDRITGVQFVDRGDADVPGIGFYQKWPSGKIHGAKIDFGKWIDAYVEKVVGGEVKPSPPYELPKPGLGIGRKRVNDPKLGDVYLHLLRLCGHGSMLNLLLSVSVTEKEEQKFDPRHIGVRYRVNRPEYGINIEFAYRFPDTESGKLGNLWTPGREGGQSYLGPEDLWTPGRAIALRNNEIILI